MSGAPDAASAAMGDVLALIRPDLRDFAGYASARRAKVSGNVWLNANESPLPSEIDPGLSLNRYPEPQPAILHGRMAGLYAVRPEQLMVTRGSDEGIDLLVRAFCRAGIDAVLIAPPCFGMYAVCARLQNAPLVEVPLDEVNGIWTLDLARVVEAVEERKVRIVFLCSPANPTGQALSLAELRGLADALQGSAMLVIDEAYVEFSSIASASGLLDTCPNLVVLRTLSKAHALAGARVGSVLANAAVISVLRNISAPYPVPAPSAALALAALSAAPLEQATRRCRASVEERDRLMRALTNSPGVRRVYASEGNYLLVRFDDSQQVFERLLAAGVVVRDMRAMPQLQDALRISIGTAEENQQLLSALRQAVTA
jgi:histidinol-phosphate aminotransferase